MRRLCLLAMAIVCLLPLSLRAQGTAAIQNHCYLGGTQAKTSGLNSTNYQLGIVPSCQVKVFLTGTQTLATIFRDASGDTLSNPFTANATNAVDPGGWNFWAAVNIGYDIVLSGGIPPNTYATPVTLVDRYPGFSFSGGGGTVTPCGTTGQIQIANASGTALNCDSNFFINPLTHTYTSPNGNMLVGALSSVPRAVYDPMDTSYDGGLAAAIAGSSGFTPAQVLQATADYGECQKLMGRTIFTGVRIPLPAGVQIFLSQVLLWENTDFGSDGSISTYPTLQHNDATKEMIRLHNAGDTITCSNGTTYNPIPGGAGGDYIHDFAISGMFAPATTTDIGILLNGGSSVARNIAGGGNGFGGPAVISTGTTDFLQQLGFPGGQLDGCHTYTSGVLPIASYGPGSCGAVMNLSLDGGMDNVYATDGQAFAPGHAAGPCYPKCAAVVAGDNEGYDNNIFAQISDIGVIFTGSLSRATNFRIDDTSREAIRIVGSGGNKIDQVGIDSSCVDTALQANFNANIATGCGSIINATNGGAGIVSSVSVVNNAGIFSPSYNQCWISDGGTGFSGTSNTYGATTYQGSPNNLTPNNWLACGAFGNDQIAGRFFFPSTSPMRATQTTINANGVTSVTIAGQTVTNIMGGIAGQHLLVTGSGTMAQSSGGINTIANLNGINAVLTGNQQTFEYVNFGTLPNNTWWMLSGPPNQTPTHVNYAGNPTPSSPSLNSVYGNTQSLQVPAFTITSAVQLHGPTAPSGQACFEQEALYPDGSHVVSAQTCTTVDLATQTGGEIFAVLNPQATMNLWLVSNTEPSAVVIGKFPPVSGSNWDGPTTIAAGGNGATAPAASENNTGSALISFGIYGPATAPSGTCTAGQGGATVISRDGHATYCPIGGGTWATKF